MACFVIHGKKEFRYSTKCERACVVFAVILAIVSGSIPPIINILYGEFCNLMIDRQYPTNAPTGKMHFLPLFGGGKILQNASLEERQAAMVEDSTAWGSGCAIFTTILFLLSMVSVFLLCYTSSRQISRIKILFFKSILCKDITWFDTRMKGNFAVQATENVILLERGIADSLSVFTFHVSIGLFNILISFLYGWLLAMTLLVIITPVGVCALYIARAQSRIAIREMEAFTRAANLAAEVFTCIRTVVAFGGEEKEIRRYTESLTKANKYEIRRAIASGISNGLVWFIIYCSYSVAFVFGVRLIESSLENGDKEYTPAVLLIIFFGIITALTSLGYASGTLETFSLACGAASSVFEIINTKTTINPCSDAGDRQESCDGQIEFKQVYFEYPSRTGSMTLKGLNLKVNAGETVAIVGESGAGKSTLLHLVQRLYDPSKGKILLDGQDIKTLNVTWLREQFGVVNQDPILFSTTIRDNIWYGNLSATEEDIKQAAINAGAYNFIMDLKEGFNTIVGQRGATLSGGQKQRIAIARALIRNPRILLLDEATSALDATSEKLTRAALEKAAEGRTTLIVTHSLSTIINADRIIVLSDGVVVEDGTHNDLMKANGVYKHLFDTRRENFRARKTRDKGQLEPKLGYRDSAVLPPGPRGRFNSLTGLPKSQKSELPRGSEQFKDIRLSEIIKWTRSELPLFFVGFAASIICGTALPTVCVLFGDTFGLLALADFDYVKHRTDYYAAILVAVGVASGICVYVQIYCFAVASTKLSTRLRIKAFRCMINQEIGYFEDEKNTVGALCVRLSQDASGIHGAFDIRLGVLLQALSTMVIGLFLSFMYNLKLTLVTLATIPFLFSGVYIESVFASGVFTLENKALERATKIGLEVIHNIRSVASLTRESFFIEKYTEAVNEGRKNTIEKFWLRGFAFAVGQAAPFFGYAVTLWYGGKLMAEEDISFKYVIKVSELLIFGTWTLGQSMVLGPTIRDTKIAAGKLNFLFTRHSKVPDGHAVIPRETNNAKSISFSRVHFAYPTRPGSLALQNFAMKVEGGHRIAVMGSTGSGKSTIIHLLLRFYDPLSGSIYISKSNIKGFKLSSLRQIFGLVSQRPEFFDRSIAENIAYGDNTREVSLDEVVEAAKAANIHSFIESLPLGYDSKLGAGTQLSGGQKQKIAIARILVRNPEIILLDEATSAMDPENEDVVQKVLDSISAEKTTVTVAHRMSAVKNADFIYIVEKGTVVESGTREELMSLRGLFYSMYGSEEEEKISPNISGK